MTQYELIKTTESMCRALADNNVNPCDVKYLEVYEQLERMEREGHKKTFIVAYLCSQYEMHEATLYRVANRMRKQVQPF